MAGTRRSSRLREKSENAASSKRSRKKSSKKDNTPVKKSSKKASTPRSTTRKSQSKTKQDEQVGQNWVHSGIENNPYFLALIICAPFIAQLLGFLTSESMKLEPHLSTLVPLCWNDLQACGQAVFQAGYAYQPTIEAFQFLGCFFGLALLLELLPGKIACGPETLTGHIPKYKDNGVIFCFFYSWLFWAGSNLGVGNLYDFGIIFDVFPSSIIILNVFGILVAAFFNIKGLYFPSTQDSGTTGSWAKDFMWGTELYPRVGGLDLKRFINCRFSMTFWQLAGVSFAYRSYTIHGEWDYGLVFAAISQYLYLVKFFYWEMGYMRSIDIIVDRAGFEIQWGCLVWVPAVYTFHSRFSVLHPSQLGFYPALALFILSMSGVALNYAADYERDYFRAKNGECLVWGKKPRFIKAKYVVVDPKTGEKIQRESLLLASGFWGIARHFQYTWELTAAWSWCLLANPLQNGLLPLFYAAFLTYLLIDRATRDSEKCHLKYGKYYEEYCRLVPYKILPGVY